MLPLFFGFHPPKEGYTSLKSAPKIDPSFSLEVLCIMQLGIYGQQDCLPL